MIRRHAVRGWWGNAAIAVMALLFLAAGFCCLDRDSMDHHHAVPMGLCSAAVMITVASLAVLTLPLLGLTPIAGPEAFATIPLAVPKPPPRRLRFS